MNAETTLLADCPATRIPQGEAVMLPKGGRVYITQTLGASVTLRTEDGLFRVASENTGAIAGYEKQTSSDVTIEGEFGEAQVWAALKQCFDPEIPVNIVDLGLIYDLAIELLPSGKHHVDVKMTLTAQGCGMGPVIAEDARSKIAALPAVESAKVVIVWEPVWTPHMISQEGRLALGLE